MPTPTMGSWRTTTTAAVASKRLIVELLTGLFILSVRDRDFLVCPDRSVTLIGLESGAASVSVPAGPELSDHRRFKISTVIKPTS